MSSGSSSSPSFTSSERQPPRRLPATAWAAAFLAVAILITLAWASFRSTRPVAPAAGSPPRLEKLLRAPEFELFTHDGGKLSRPQLEGSVWVANFFFTRCTGPCPALISRMAELQQKLGRADAGTVRLLSFTVDPAHDTPEVLRRYAEAVGAREGRWAFLTGPPAHVEAVVVKGFLQPLVKSPGAEPEHSTRFVVVDQRGWIRAFYDGNDPEVVQKLLMDIGELLRESSKR